MFTSNQPNKRIQYLRLLSVQLVVYYNQYLRAISMYPTIDRLNYQYSNTGFTPRYDNPSAPT